MGNLNKVMLIGRLGQAPEMRYTQSGSPVAHFSIAIRAAACRVLHTCTIDIDDRSTTKYPVLETQRILLAGTTITSIRRNA